MLKPTGASHLLSRGRNLPVIFAETKRIIEKTLPDVVHAHSAGAYAWLAMFLHFHPYVVTPWGTDILVGVKQSRWNRLITTMTLRHADLVTCDAYHMKDAMVRLGVSEEKFELVMFGVDLSRFSSLVDDGRLRNDYRLGDSPIVISTRTLTPVHDVRTFVQAIPLIKQCVPEAAFVILGDGPERRDLEVLVESLGMREFVRFVGHVNEGVMERWLRTADVYVSTSLADAGLAASTAEAMACELPVVVTENGDNRNWVQEDAGGFLVPVSAPGILAARVVHLLKQSETRSTFGRLNRQIIEKRNNYTTEMGRMEAIYMRLCDCA